MHYLEGFDLWILILIGSVGLLLAFLCSFIPWRAGQNWDMPITGFLGAVLCFIACALFTPIGGLLVAGCFWLVIRFFPSDKLAAFGTVGLICGVAYAGHTTGTYSAIAAFTTQATYASDDARALADSRFAVGDEMQRAVPVVPYRIFTAKDKSRVVGKLVDRGETTFTIRRPDGLQRTLKTENFIERDRVYIDQVGFLVSDPRWSKRLLEVEKKIASSL